MRECNSRNCYIGNFNVSIKRSAHKSKHVEVVEQHVLCGRVCVKEAFEVLDKHMAVPWRRGSGMCSESVRKFALLPFPIVICCVTGAISKASVIEVIKFESQGRRATKDGATVIGYSEVYAVSLGADYTLGLNDI